ncbi:glutamate dehydrogenase [Branchiibius hedensis]|uniref:Glutamate dehydrogenase n=1 Tax=Branchiibius hedensis TaxID=672460 RepID=A0A2Y8ZTH6_9MICO|nr:NAD-glutamate dehydrogenase [Branchiibius hedensis]PWJ25994.1 glutamate dehydrogenase [Branchiibius hedensis]SSA34806.1 glutamate dehydrogenase [Branchiibius hedensis]
MPAVNSATVSASDQSVSEQLVSSYFEHTAAEDFQTLSPPDVSGIVRSHLALARERRPGTTNVEVFTPHPDSDGWGRGLVVAQIVTDDMPFIVDTVLAALSRAQRSVRLLVHPQFDVRRSASGELESVTAAADDGDDATIRESWLHVEFARGRTVADDEELQQTLAQVMADLHAAVEDWPQMRERCWELAGSVAEEVGTRVDEDQIRQCVEMLRWLADDNFTFIGYRDYRLAQRDGMDGLAPVEGSGLGVLRDDHPDSFRPLTPEAARTAHDPRLLTITKANSLSTVHRSAHLDYIGVRVFDDAGAVIGERRFIGLFAARAYNETVRRVPVARDKVEQVLAATGYAADSHDGRDVLQTLETYPRDEVLQADVPHLVHVAQVVSRLKERRCAGVLRRDDEFGRFVSVVVYVPRDAYDTTLRLRMTKVLQESYRPRHIEHEIRLNDADLAYVHFVVWLGQERPAPISDQDFDDRLLRSVQTWGQHFAALVRDQYGDEAAARITADYVHAFPEAYKEDFTAAQGLADLQRIEALDGPDPALFALYRESGSDPRERRFKIFRRDRLILTDVVGMFTDFGVEVTDERPYSMRLPDGSAVWIYDIGLRSQSPTAWGGEDADQVKVVRGRFEDAFAAVWDRRADSDRLGGLVLSAGLTWRQVAVLRTVGRYLRQTAFSLSYGYIQDALLANPDLAVLLSELFEQRFDPALRLEADERASHQHRTLQRIDAALTDVASLDHDRIVRAIRGVVRATLRTNAFRPDSRVIALKLDCHGVPDLPEPIPMFEIWVHGPDVEGVHLRFGKVARGGLRWSDRRDDFRTEILGLVKAQMVKNALIVPTGAKGGFVARHLPDPSDRDAFNAAGVAAYQQFIASLLEVTDNLVSGVVVPPRDVVRYDDDDTYLVVAADKGTATFSDIANGIARENGFWLDDAFASGGSAGYDHKAMGITARGAWESVKRHFREMGVDTQTQEFTAAGIGDMSGDVFGNGMLLSEHLRLVAAFDHRHVFLDPDPDAASSYAERRRLFELPRSSWDSYDRQLISAGGGVYPRTAKSVPISDQVRRALGLGDDITALTPAELIRAILRAPVDLLWNGGIGTYVRSSLETDAQIGDRTNDAVRISADQLRCKVIGEGGNLGLSQLARIEAAQNGVRVNTDAIDNSAGVDTSDHEVNIKIAAAGLVRDGSLELSQRDELLASMTDEIAHQVLRDNYEQNVLLGNARAQEHAMLPVHRRFMAAVPGLDRELEFLPSDEALDQRDRAGHGLCSPEFSVLVAYAKLDAKRQLLQTNLPDDPWFEATLSGYFPAAMRRYDQAIAAHPLRREIVTTCVVNDLVNRGGITFVFRAQEETGATADQIARAFVIVREVFGMRELLARIEATDNVVSTDTQTRMYLEVRRLLDRATRWFIHNRPADGSIAQEIERFRPVVSALRPRAQDFLRGSEHDRWATNADRLRQDGVPQDLADEIAALLDAYSLLDIARRSQITDTDPAEVARTYFACSERLQIDRLLHAVSALPRDDLSDALARSALREDLYGVLDSFVDVVLRSTDQTPDRVDQWATTHQAGVERAARAVAVLPPRSAEPPTLAQVLVALRALRSVATVGDSHTG